MTEKMHYDLRLEINGVLVSWALSKGISTDTATRRMGIKIEDQDMEYYNYEGMVEEEKYGKGEVIIWDRGEYRNLRIENEDDLNMEESLENGHIKIFVEGKKLKGGFTLIDVPYGKTKWLQVKEKDDYVDESNSIMEDQPDSILSDP